ncbi:hypothetical protein GCM10007414_31630 [Agarivorans gilvus]|uniref:DUF4136 domain-containing protein n=1 Tax=Agarivorans gilvus TaxID=680279 RepID=A0ABQ1I513_9ALTE|nr:hypothetical protein GCM10007414_31630 [Agarivorans gilvus]
MLVLVANEDRNARVGAESRIVEALQQKGVAASASYNIISDMAALEQPNQLAEQMAKQGYDAIVTIRTVDEGYEFGYDDYLANRGFVYLLGGEPGAGTQIGSLISWAGSGQYALLLTLWDIDSQTVVWKATTDSVQTASESESIQSLAQLVEERLGSQGIELK